MAKRNAGLDAFLASYPPLVQNIFAEFREPIFATLPQPEETLDTARKLTGYGFGPRYADMVCTLIPSKGDVKLGLAWGVSLPDPKGLLAGERKVHRHGNFQTLADLKRAGVKPLLKAALAARQARVAHA